MEDFDLTKFFKFGLKLKFIFIAIIGFVIIAGFLLLNTDNIKESEKVIPENKTNQTEITDSNIISSCGFVFPVFGLNINNINNKNYPSYSGHTGVDVNIGVSGKKVVAVADGTVVTSTALKNSNGTYRSYGEYIILYHENVKLFTLYAHMFPNSRTVNAGDKVIRGQILGQVGTTGNSTGLHLHFEVRNSNKKPINPIPYLPH